MTKLYLLAKKIHRFLVLIITAIATIMVGTGLMMKYSWTPFGANLAKARYIHNQLSVVFAVILFFMTATGTTMYLLLYLIKKRGSGGRQ